MRQIEGEQHSYVSVCGGAQEMACAYGRRTTAKRFAHYLNDYSRPGKWCYTQSMSSIRMSLRLNI